MARAVDLNSPWEIEVGDRILGTQLIVTDKPHAVSVVHADGQDYSPEAVYGARGGVRIQVGERSLTYAADKKMTVMR